MWCSASAWRPSRSSAFSSRRTQQVGFRDPDVLAVLLSLTQGLPLVARRRAPVAVLGVVSVATVGFLAAGYPPLTTALLGAVVAT